MNNAYEEYLLVLTKWKEFKENVPSSNLDDFALWLLKEKPESRQTGLHESFILDRVAAMQEKAEMPDLANRGLIGHLLGRMNLFVKNYAKVPFQQIGFSNLEEFRILQIIDRIKKY